MPIAGPFQEKQKFSRLWVVIIQVFMLAAIAIFAYALYQQMVLDKPFGTKPAPNYILIIGIIVCLAFSYFFFSLTLITEINEEGVFYRWAPFYKRFSKYNWPNVAQAQIIQYGFVGYGYRFTKYGVVRNTSGNKGIQLILKSGKKFVFGTQKPEELEQYLMQLKTKGIVKN